MNQPQPKFRAARNETRVAVLLLCAVGATLFGLDLAAQNRALAIWLYRQSEPSFRAAGLNWPMKLHFREPEDALFLEELPTADYSRGGVYVLGASNVVAATRLWDLPPAERALVHNYGIQGVNYTAELAFVKYLVERKQLLRAGSEKTLVILGLSYQSTRDFDACWFFDRVWARHDLYDCDAQQGIREADIDAVRHYLRIARVRIPGFLLAWRHYLGDRLKMALAIDPGPSPRRHDVQRYRAQMEEVLGSEWERAMERQLPEFGRLIDYLQEHQVPTIVTLMPVPSWEGELPYARKYDAGIRAMCREKGVDLRDWSTMLDDEEFADYSHPNVEGQAITNRALLEQALPFLKETGALPADGTLNLAE